MAEKELRHPDDQGPEELDLEPVLQGKSNDLPSEWRAGFRELTHTNKV